MLFLFSPKGMGIAPIIKLSVVNGTCIPLLFLPRFHGFGTNESQPSCCIHCTGIFEWFLGLSKNTLEHIRLLSKEHRNILGSFGGIARFTGKAKIANTVRTTVGARMNVLNLQGNILLATIGTGSLPFEEQEFPHLIAL